MRTIRAAGLAAIAVSLQAGTALAHPGHGIAPSGTPGHSFEHLAAVVASSPVAWLAVAGLGLVALSLIRRRSGPRTVRIKSSRRP